MPVTIRPLQESELPAADRIMRLAFGAFLGIPEPEKWSAGRDFILPRWRADPLAILAAELDGELAGTNVVTHWGSFAFFGPLTIRPERWNQGIAQKLIESTLAMFDKWDVAHAGLFTFPHSTKHIALYQKFGFWPRFLTAIMIKPVNAPGPAPLGFSQLDDAAQASAIDACRGLTASILDGLDVTREIRAVHRQKLGETVLLPGGSGFAICHCGARTEAGPENCYIKFAAARDEKSFELLLENCESLAASRGMARVEAGVNLARSEAYRGMLRHGFRTAMQGVAMQRPDGPAFNRAGVFILDDWR